MTIRFAPHCSIPYFIPIRKCCLVILLALLCGTSCSAKTVQSATPGKGANIEQQLRQAARQWDSTPHRLGGLSHKGIDCSGLVKVLYSKLFNLELPRTTRQQARIGVAVEQKRLKPGDLVFFRPPGKSGHVGIYLGKNDFLHATTRRGVIISRLSERYWRNYYWTARRIIPPA